MALLKRSKQDANFLRPSEFNGHKPISIRNLGRRRIGEHHARHYREFSTARR
jgi:hypothetical protein